eukprot:ANDGO_04456.mRNA.1 hypothetical protein
MQIPFFEARESLRLPVLVSPGSFQIPSPQPVAVAVAPASRLGPAPEEMALDHTFAVDLSSLTALTFSSSFGPTLSSMLPFPPDGLFFTSDIAQPEYQASPVDQAVAPASACVNPANTCLMASGLSAFGSEHMASMVSDVSSFSASASASSSSSASASASASSSASGAHGRDTNPPVLKPDEWTVVGHPRAALGSVRALVRTKKSSELLEFPSRFFWTSRYVWKLVTDDLEILRSSVKVSLLNGATLNEMDRGLVGTTFIDRLETQDSIPLAFKFATHSARENGAEFRLRFFFSCGLEMFSPSFQVLARRPNGEVYAPKKRSYEAAFLESPEELSFEERVAVMQRFLTVLSVLEDAEEVEYFKKRVFDVLK